MRAWAAWVGWCSLWLGACGGADGPASAPPRDLFRDVPAVMPTLEPVMLTQYDPAVITGSPVGIAVTADGLIAMLDPDGPDDPGLVLIDAVSGATRQVIRRGMGPGELSGAGQVFAARDRIVILDFAKMALITVDAAGEVIDERSAPVHDARIVVFGGDSMARSRVAASGPSSPPMSRSLPRCARWPIGGVCPPSPPGAKDSSSGMGSAIAWRFTMPEVIPS